ncbi:hypothetical protein KHQ06_24630 [Nocardia tengchongensis]|uniref:Uncharacterized protein n=1 Tax=Nocardia tengchongensis TaxID=2055889 RepID=A0ABX8CHV1_9NOCA|nr:hypothetical protein [Nocardia tengchongensis]QVI19547.1 hypothetical protein KHQ06_24630 [Nocardia tengchongensis]
MTESPRPRRRRPRGQDSPELVARLERSHQRSLERRAAATEREKTITRAVGDYLTAWQAISAVEDRRDRDVAALREQIDAVLARAASDITTYEQAQAAAAAAVRAHVQSDEELADLLEITVKRARQLLAVWRTADTEPLPASATPHPRTPQARKLAAPRNLSADAQSNREAAPGSTSDET